MEKIYIKQTLSELSISKSKLYRLLKQLGIMAHKDGKKSYFTKNQLEKIREESQKSHRTNTENTIETEQLKEELKRERLENKRLILEVGQWQGRAKTLEEQNEKLLILEAPKKQEEKKGFFKRLFNL